MGVVYKARQIALNRVVALKMLAAGPHAGPDLLARFRAEAEAVARLQHPNIVQIYEVGQADGLPFLALEYVEGGALTQKAGGRPQPAREAAQTVLPLARALHLAHERGVLHRDLKPANVLLGPEGMVKITDFGLAKQLEGQGLTRTGEIMGTPSYMAPEQASGAVKRLGPAVDVYALGAVLYELLTGRPPFLAESPVETVVQVLSSEPVPPRRLQPKVPHDLETICLKCLHKEPKKRYPSAAALADDLEHFLQGEPIRARPTPGWERAWKWARRRRALAALVAVVAVALASLVVGGLLHNARLQKEKALAEREGRRAERRFRLALSAVDRMLTRISEDEDRLAHEPRMELVRRKLLEDALEVYQELLQEKSDDLQVRQEMGRVLYRVGDIRRALGAPREAKEALDQAIALFQQLVAERPQEASYQEDLAKSYYRLADVLRDLGQGPEAERAFLEAVRRQEDLVRAAPDVAAYRQGLAQSLNNLGNLLNEVLHRPEEAKGLYLRSLHLREQLVQESPDHPAYQKDLSQSYHNLAYTWQKARRWDEAEQTYRKAVVIREKLAQRFPKAPVYRQYLGRTLNNLGLSLRLAGKHPEAEKVFCQALPLRKQLVAEFPHVTKYRDELAQSYFNWGMLYGATNCLPEALGAFGDAVAIREPLAREHPAVPEYRRFLGETYHQRAQALLRKGDTEGALADLTKTYFYRGLDHYARKEPGRALADFKQSILLQPKWAEAHNHRGQAYSLNKDYVQAAADYRQAISLDAKYALAHANLARLLASCPNANLRDGAQALRHARKACELTEGPDASSLDALAAAWAETGQFQNAVQAQKEALEAPNFPPTQREWARQRLELYRQGKPYRDDGREGPVIWPPSRRKGLSPG
jgi:tetratricopeptide (TPR) repeat protein